MTEDEWTTCPKCGDRVPIDLGKFECAGPGHHVAVLRSSVYPATTQADVERAWRRAMQNVVSTLILVLVLIVAVVAARVGCKP